MSESKFLSRMSRCVQVTHPQNCQPYHQALKSIRQYKTCPLRFTAAWASESSPVVLVHQSMTVSPTRKPICSWPLSQKTLNQEDSTDSLLAPKTVEWRFEKGAAQSAANFEGKLQIQKQLADAGAPVQRLLSHKRFERNGEHIIQAEFENIPHQISPTWRHVNECLDAMISCFFALAWIHAHNVHHGNPCIDNFIFQRVDNTDANTGLTKGYLTNFHDCGDINEDQTRCKKDVQIALADFGGQLLMVAENSGFTQIRFLKMHLEAQVNFADQEELDSLEDAPTLLNHLYSLKTLLKLRQRDYPRHYRPAWGPLNQEQVLNEYLELQKEKSERTAGDGL